MKIVILDGYTENPGDLSWGGFEALGSVTVYDRTPADQILARAKGAEIVLTNKTPLSAQTLAALAPELQYIGVLATGYNVVDIAAARAQGIPVCNIPTLIYRKSGAAGKGGESGGGRVNKKKKNIP